MQDTLRKSLKNLKWRRMHKKRLSAIVVVLSLVVTLNVFWALRQPGLTLAGDAACGIPEHSHKDECFTQVNICGLSEDAHTHDAACYTTQFIEAQETRRLSCDRTEQPHVHSDSCYEITAADSAEESVLNCELQFDPHVHTEDCYTLEVTEAHEEQILTCGLSETAHLHEEACYSQECSCTQQEHTHSTECYSDETADAETLLDWQNMFAGYPFTGNLREDLVGIAKTQVGYSESTRNFEVGSDGIRRGYTRYGAWYGTPYRDWSAAFVSFCLNYAGADPAQTPGNIGAGTMAELWKNLGRFAPAGEYVPTAGDLVFFTNHTVGIVTEVQNTTFNVIHGDREGSVCTDAIPFGDVSISGWGITGEIPTEEPVDAPTQKSGQSSFPEALTAELLDISNGPAFYIFAGGRSEPAQQQFSFTAPRTTANIYEYLTGNGGSYFITLKDANNKELPKDENKNYIVKSGTSYKMSMTFNGPNGIHPGTYQYQLPQGLQITGGAGNFTLKDTDGSEVNVGTWEVGDDGRITMVLNKEMNNRTDVLITATMDVVFPEQEEPLHFDGNIIVTIEPPSPTEEPTVLLKWGSQGKEAENQDPSKIYWTVQISGKKDSHIPGSIVTDQVTLGEHRYMESDQNGGLRFVVGEPNPEPGADPIWHNWMVYPGDLKLSWGEDGWTYEIPESIVCGDCGRNLTLGNTGWEYYVHYTSTPIQWGVSGNREYMNQVTVDGQQQYGWVSFSHGKTNADIIKNGSFHGNAEGGVFLWEVQAVIPGIQEGQKAAYFWYIMDYLRVRNNENDFVGYIENDADQATVTAINNGNTITVPNIKDATASDPFAWKNAWSESADGASYARELEIVCRCACTEENCSRWNAANHKCDNIMVWDNADFCQCWVVEGDTLFTFSYQTNDPAIMEAYGGQGNSLHNEAVLYNKIPMPDWSDPYVRMDGTEKSVPIPGVFKKELKKEFDGYAANYLITVNESKLPLTNGSPLTIHDEMTPTLAYISGSLKITTEDANGNTGTLQQDVDYTVTYDGTGVQTDTNGNPVHVMDIVILQPQPVMYLLDYDTALIIPDNVTEAVKYSNSATITLWGKEITDESDEAVLSEINISAKTYRVQLYKTESQEGAPLAGATFGLFHAQGGKITEDTTDASGNILFETSITDGIILREHVLYYMQELNAPPGYRLDDTKYWFCFCNSKADSCETCTEVMAGLQAVRIPSEQIGKVAVENERMTYDLPATGGPGIYPLILVSVLFIMTPLVYVSIQKRRCME